MSDDDKINRNDKVGLPSTHSSNPGSLAILAECHWSGLDTEATHSRLTSSKILQTQ